MRGFNGFLHSMWKLYVRVGSTRPDTTVTAYSASPHLGKCMESYLTPEVPVAVEGRYLVGATILCPHGETGSVEFSIDQNLWILQQNLIHIDHGLT